MTQRRCGLCRGLGHRRESCTAPLTGQSPEEIARGNDPKLIEKENAMRERVTTVQLRTGDLAKMRARIGLPPL